MAKLSLVEFQNMKIIKKISSESNVFNIAAIIIYWQ